MRGMGLPSVPLPEEGTPASSVSICNSWCRWEWIQRSRIINISALSAHPYHNLFPPLVLIFVDFLLSETGPQQAALADLKLEILLPQPLEC